MLEIHPAEITHLLQLARQGDPQAREELAPIIQDALHHYARLQLSRERGNHTLQPTALVNEAWMRLFPSHAQPGEPGYEWRDRAHFLAVASHQIREILVDYARTKKAAKRSGQQVELADDLIIELPKQFEFLALSEALDRLTAQLPRAAKIVEMLFFGGLTYEEAAEVLGISLSTLKRDWKFAQAWLFKELSASLSENPPERDEATD